MTSAKEQYRILCEEKGAAIPLFQQYWWMEAVCRGKRWEVALATDSSGAIEGALPYLIGSRYGLRYIVQPQLTQYNGIWYNYPADAASENRRLIFEQRVAEKIIAQIKELHLAYYQQNFSPDITNWLPFYWAGFRQTTRYTYRIEDIGDTDKVYDGFNHNERQRRIERLMPTVSIVELDAKGFEDFHSRCRKEMQQRDILQHSLVTGLCDAALGRGQALCYGLKNNEGELMSALFVPYDKSCAYYLIPALMPQYRNIGAMETLIWLTLHRLSGTTRSFDFEGSMDKGIEHFYRSFGATQKAYHSISRCIVPFIR